MKKLIRLPEPKLLFHYDQTIEDPRDGLTLFGPLEQGKPYGIKAGVIGTFKGISLYKEWIKRIQSPILSNSFSLSRPPYPGFETIFRIPWESIPSYEIEVSEHDLKNCLYLEDKHYRVYNTVELFSKKIIETIKQEESKIDVWFVIIPDEVKQYCRPKSQILPDLKIKHKPIINKKQARRL